MNQARQRREEIRSLIRETEVHSQEELQRLLRRKGYRVTQPTLSRDLHDLGLAKTPAGYLLPEQLAAPAGASVHPFIARSTREERFEQAVREFVLTAETSGTLVVVRTPPAGAQPVALAIDAAGLDQVVGTIGGDDTIFVATRSAKAAAALARRLTALAGPRPNRRPRA
ncbi:MAG TPA: hypothetical protein VM534_07135 [Thermoanaerobaculia bacterium]|nr:hypothetical protein [Thermoanaerobaculia bacterium]